MCDGWTLRFLSLKVENIFQEPLASWEKQHALRIIPGGWGVLLWFWSLSPCAWVRLGSARSEQTSMAGGHLNVVLVCPDRAGILLTPAALSGGFWWDRISKFSGSKTCCFCCPTVIATQKNVDVSFAVVLEEMDRTRRNKHCGSKGRPAKPTTSKGTKQLCLAGDA